MAGPYRSNLQLSVLARSVGLYYLYTADNTVQPHEFIGNKVAGILFENKADHTTFFSPDIEAIQGIHMIPLLAPTPLVRRPAFVREEWEAFFSRGRIEGIRNGWASIIYGSYSTVNPRLAWDFFTSPEFDLQWLDGGVSLTWLQAYAAGECLPLLLPCPFLLPCTFLLFALVWCLGSALVLPTMPLLRCHLLTRGCAYSSR